MSNEITEDGLRQAFEVFGRVTSVKIVKDRKSGKSNGFGFIEMQSESEAKSSIYGLNGKELKGRRLDVNKDCPRSDKGLRGGGKADWTDAAISSYGIKTYKILLLRSCIFVLIM